MKTKNKLYYATAAVLFSATAAAESLRCGDRLVAIGDDKSWVLRHCGKPLLKERPQTKTQMIAGEHGESTRQRVRIEHWVYDSAPGQMTRRVVFADGKVAEIEVGDRR